MNTQEIKTLYNEFLSTYNAEEIDSIWKKQSSKFQDFWTNKIINPNHEILTEGEIDEIVRFLDRNAKGNIKGSESVAKVMIPQGKWRRMFNDIKNNAPLAKIMMDIFLESNQEKRRGLIDQLYKINEDQKNSLTGKSGNAISAMLCAWDPFNNLSIVSLNHRKKLIDYFKFEGGTDFENDSIGEQIAKSNDQIINGFKSLGLKGSINTITRFLYRSKKINSWRTESKEGKAQINKKDNIKSSSSNPKFWIEKTICHNRPDRLAGDFSLGNALWSPQESQGGQDLTQPPQSSPNVKLIKTIW